MHLVGMSSTHAMTEIVLLDSLDQSIAHYLLQKSPVMNAYQTFEIVSDDLALGLGMDPEADDSSKRRRRRLVTRFNEVAVRSLSKMTPPSPSLLGELRSSAEQIDFLSIMLNGPAYSRLVDAYADECGQKVHTHVSASLWPMLVGNIAAARDVLSAVKGLGLASEVKRDLLARYTAVNQLVRDDNPVTGLTRRLDISADAILVAATLGYYFAFLLDREEYRTTDADKVRPMLRRALTDCARMVRLLNDIGPSLLKARTCRDDLVRRITAAAAGTQARFDETLINVCTDDVTSTRLEKDLAHGETNLFLAWLHLLPAPQAAPHFVHRLNFYSNTYRQSARSLHQTCKEIDHITGRSDISIILLRFLELHERLYANSFKESTGEYSGVPLDS